MPVKQITNWTVFNKIQTATMTFIACLTRFRLISHPFENLHRIPTGPLRFITVPIAYPFPSEPPRECPYPRKHWKKRHVSAQLRLQDDTGADPRFCKKTRTRRSTIWCWNWTTLVPFVFYYTQRRTLAYSADRQAASLPPVPSLPALGLWAPPPAERGPSQESIYRVSLTVDLCEG